MTIKLSFRGKTQTLLAWARELGVVRPDAPQAALPRVARRKDPHDARQAVDVGSRVVSKNRHKDEMTISSPSPHPKDKYVACRLRAEPGWLVVWLVPRGLHAVEGEPEELPQGASHFWIRVASVTEWAVARRPVMPPPLSLEASLIDLFSGPDHSLLSLFGGTGMIGAADNALVPVVNGQVLWEIHRLAAPGEGTVESLLSDAKTYLANQIDKMLSKQEKKKAATP